MINKLTVKNLLSISSSDFSKLSQKDLKKAVSVLASAGNKRLRRLEKSGVTSSAYRHITHSGGDFSIKGKNLNQLRSEFIRAKNFLQSKGGSVTGARKIQRETISSLEKVGVTLTEKQYNDFWEAYEKIKELSPEVANRRFKYGVLQNIADYMNDTDNMDVDDIVSTIYENLSLIYEESAVLDDDASVSKFFAIE